MGLKPTNNMKKKKTVVDPTIAASSALIQPNPSDDSVS